jgi:hypothetical protein
MEFKVKAVEVGEEKSTQEIERELLEKHEEKLNQEVAPDVEVQETPKVNLEVQEETPQVEEPTKEVETQSQEATLTEEDVLKFIGNKYGREINSLDEFNQAREESDPLPEDVSKYLQYKKDTGRGINDFMQLQKNYDDAEPEQLLRDYLSATEKGLDAEDIEILMEDYSYDEDIDDDSHIKKTKLAKKKTIAKAKDYFAEQQEKYKVPLESRRDGLPDSEAKELEEYRQYIADAKTIDEQNSRKREMFSKKTDDVFNEFKGFEFKLGEDKSISFSPGDAAELRKSQSDPSNFIKKFLDEDGIISDAEGYHKSLAMAMHPDKFAKFFYEQGKSASADEQMRKMKNVNMTTRSAPEVTQSKSGMQIKSLNKDSGRGLKIRKR